MTMQEAREAYDRAGTGLAGVVYTGAPTPEPGVISSVNASYVFVRFSGSRSAKACRPEDLELIGKA
jgi:hypothetical protein